MSSKLAVQLYTVRDYIKTASEFAQSLEKIASIGYSAVQLSAVGAMNPGPDNTPPAVDAPAARKMLDDNGLKCIATHRSWEQLANQTEREIEFHQTLGCGYTAIGGIPKEYGQDGAEGYRRFVRDAQPIITKLKAAGIAWGHHNHAHEFERIGYKPDGTPETLWDILIDEGGPDYLLEADLYWVWHAGVDPSDLVTRCQGRVPVIHLKDKEVIAKDGPVIAPIGEGNLPWSRILPACEEAGVEWYAIEQDTCRRDPFDCLRSSFEFLTGRGL